MDPDANLEEQLAQANAWVNAEDGEEFDPVDVQRMAELVLSLNDWITGGGFLPKPWREAK